MKYLKLSYYLYQLVFLLVFSINIRPQWNLQYSRYGEWLNCIYFVDYNNGWAVGGRLYVGALILKSTDGGTTWNDNLTIPGTVNFFNSVYFTDADNGWVVGQGAIMMQTTNAGVTWDTVTIPTNAYLHQIQFIDEDYGWVAGTEDNLTRGIILKTTDGGLNWERIDIGSENLFYSIYFLNQNVGWSSGGKIKKTTDGGYTWVTKNDTRGGSSIYFADELTGWSVGSSDSGPFGYIHRTTDGGETWNSISGAEIPALKSVNFFDENLGWAAGSLTGSPIIKTTDGGNSWLQQECGGINSLNSVFIIDSVTGWAAGSASILKTTNGGVTFVEEEEIKEIPARFSLSNNFPNPFNPRTKIRYSIPLSSFVQIRVIDVLGDEIAILVNEEKQAGTYEITWNAVDLASGVYFYQLKTEGFIEIKKMVLMK